MEGQYQRIAKLLADPRRTYSSLVEDLISRIVDGGELWTCNGCIVLFLPDTQFTSKVYLAGDWDAGYFLKILDQYFMKAGEHRLEAQLPDRYIPEIEFLNGIGFSVCGHLHQTALIDNEVADTIILERLVKKHSVGEEVNLDALSAFEPDAAIHHPTDGSQRRERGPLAADIYAAELSEPRAILSPIGKQFTKLSPSRSATGSV